MIIWIDAQLPPALALWIKENFSISAFPVRDLGLRDAQDDEIFLKAKSEKAIIITKDQDFSSLLDRFGPPPQIIWITCGNTSNQRLKEIFSATLKDALQLIEQGESLVEIVER